MPRTKTEFMVRLLVGVFAFATIVASVNSVAFAACTGASPVWTSTPDQASVSTCVANARSGDTLNVSAGSATWSGNVAVNNKSLSIIGAGAGSTAIKTGTFDLNTASNTRISGFTFDLQSSGSYINITNGTTDFRIDHNIFNRSGWDVCILAYNYHSLAINRGVIDNNTLYNCRLVTFGGSNGDGYASSFHWASPDPRGTANNVFIEDNTFLCPTTFCINVQDGNQGSQVVFRFNSILNGQSDLHGLQGDDERGSRSLEYYYNTFTNVGSSRGYRMGMVRAGTGMYFHNTNDGRHTVNGWTLDTPRTTQTSNCPNGTGGSSCQWAEFGWCDGSSPIDGNQPGLSGYPCRDQIGRGKDTFLWAQNFVLPYPAQTLMPIYFWNNKRTDTGAELGYSIQCPEGTPAQCARQAQQIVINRDYYTTANNFNGTVGVGEGPRANRPATCTPGVAYWVTDEGSWNTKLPPNTSGRLYQCSSTNTWTLYYTPYTYPYPRVPGGSVPSDPTNLTVR